ncbi:MAG: hybrid sensor histidine kinase/response regulator [Armatimonadota bacterium]
MEAAVVIQGLSILLQYTGAILALFLIGVTKKRAAWILIAVAVFLMATRHAITFFQQLTSRSAPHLNLSAELLTLSISMLMLAGIAFIANLFRSILRSEEALRVTQFTLDHAGDAVFWVERDGRISYVNDTACRMLGYSREQLLELTIQEIIPTMVEGVWNSFWERAHSKGSYTFESSQCTQDGQAFPAEITANNLIYGQQEFMCMLARDITDRKRAEDALRENQRRLSTLVNNLPGVAYRCANDKHWTMEYISEGCSELFGYNSEALIGNKDISFSSLIVPEDQQHVWETVQEALAGHRQFVVEYRITTHSGEQRWMWEKGSGVIDDTETLVALEGFIVDITDRKRAEEERLRLESQLRNAQKLEAIGDFAGGLAHDFNHLLMGMMSQVGQLKTFAEPGSPIHTVARTLERDGEHAAQLTNQLLGFAGKGKYQNVPVDLHEIIHETARALSASLDHNIQVQVRLTAERAIISGDPGQIKQVLDNLIENACEAMEAHGGTLTFQTQLLEADDEYVRRHPEITPGDYLEVTVTDNGVGIPQEHLGRIFEPFFTTKPAAQRSGMGLAMVYGIIENHGGNLKVDSEVGQGTTVTVHLPLAPETALTALAPETRMARGSGHILIVDFDDIARSVAAEMLQDLGYEVVTVTGGNEAVDYYIRYGNDIDLVLIEMAMPEMGGRECFQALNMLNAHVKALITTSYDLGEEAQELLAEGVLGIVLKPYNPDVLTAALREALAGKV